MTINAPVATSARGDLTVTAGGGGGWTPPSVAGLAWWYDASDAASITASAGAVSQWNDKSGNARHLTQATGSIQPSTGTRTINAKNVIDNTIPGGGGTMATGSWSLAQPITIFSVIQYDSTTGFGIWIGAGVDSPPFRMGRDFAVDNAYTYNAGTGQGIGTNDANAHQLTITLNGASSSMRVDGALLETANAGTNGVGTGLRIFRRNDTTSPFDGCIAEVFGYASAVTGADRTSAESYLKTKWGTP
jgi:hypothetical protein